MSKAKPVDKQKLRYLIPDSVNKISETFNSQVFYKSDVDKDEVIKKVKLIWKIEKAKLLERCQEHIVFDFERKLFEALGKKELSNWVDTVNNSVDPYRRQADVGLSTAKKDILNIWNNLASSNAVEADIPWMRHLKLGENFAKFVDQNNRYIFTGFTNQAILGIAMEGSDKHSDSIVISKAELDKMLLHDFKVNYDIGTPIGVQQEEFIAEKLKGLPSLTSIFKPKETHYWIKEDGSTWKRKDGKKRPPTDYDVRVNNLTKKTNVTFKSEPVWSVESISHLLDRSAQDKLDSLKSIREMDTSYVDFSDIETLDQAVSQIIKSQIKDQAIHIMQRSNVAAYLPAKDKMAVPTESSIVDPVERYMSWAKEIAKSTRHIAGRSPANEIQSVTYLQEELMSQTVGFLLVRDLEEKLAKQHPETYQASWKAQFDDFYASYDSSVPSKNSSVALSDAYTSLMAEKNAQSLLNETMSNVLNSFQIIKTGRFHGREITAHDRKSKLKGNFKTIDTNNLDIGKTDLAPPKISIDASKISDVENRAIEKAIEKLTGDMQDSKSTGPDRELALNQVRTALEDLSGHVQDRLLTLIKYVYKHPFDGPSPYDLEINYYTENALFDLYEELNNQLDKESARFKNLVKLKASGPTLDLLDYYHGNNPQLLVDVAKARALYEENEISDLRVRASYSGEGYTYDAITRKETILENLQAQIANTEEGLTKAAQYIEVKGKEIARKDSIEMD